jgi:DNA-binding SARP family transcriptional activator
VRLEIRILGPLKALVDGSPVRLGGRRQRAVLAILVAQANEVVSVERLIDGVWGEAPPETAANVLQGYVSGLRKVLGRDTIATVHFPMSPPGTRYFPAFASIAVCSPATR